MISGRLVAYLIKVLSSLSRETLDCVDCHMPLVDSWDAGNVKGKVHSHRFPAANTALPFVNHHQEQLETVTAFLEGRSGNSRYFLF